MLWSDCMSVASIFNVTRIDRSSMASDSPAPPIQRKWTANEPTGPGKWTMVAILGLLLVIAVGAFIWSISGRTKSRVFVASLNIGAYNDRDGFADPAYPNWDLQALNSLMEKRGLDKWLVAGNAATGQSMDDANAIEQAARATGTWLKRPDGLEPANATLDTVFFYLRGNCVVYDNQAWFIRRRIFSRHTSQTSHGISGIDSARCD